MSQIYMPYVRLLLNILSVGQFLAGNTEETDRHQGGGGEGGVLDLYSFSSIGLLVLSQKHF